MTAVVEAFLFLEPAADPAADRVQRGRTLFAWVPDAAAAARVADELAGAGVALIELYRGFDLADAAAVIRAVDGRVPVGVARGDGVPGRIRASVTIYADPDADPAVDRVVKDHGDGLRTTVVAAPDVESTVAVAAELAATGVDVVELCGGEPLTTAAAVARHLDGAVPVTLVTWPFESIEGAAAYKASFDPG